MADRIKAGDDVWDVQIPWAPVRCTVLKVKDDWATITRQGREGHWRTLLDQLEPVSAVDLLGEVGDG